MAAVVGKSVSASVAMSLQQESISVLMPISDGSSNNEGATATTSAAPNDDVSVVMSDLYHG